MGLRFAESFANRKRSVHLVSEDFQKYGEIPDERLLAPDDKNSISRPKFCVHAKLGLNKNDSTAFLVVERARLVTTLAWFNGEWD